MHFDAHLGQEFVRRGGDALGQGGQDAGRGLHQHDADVALGLDAVQPISHHGAHGAVQLGRKLRAGRGRADDGHMKLAGAHRLGLGVGAQAGIHQTAVEAAGLVQRLQWNGVLRGT